MKKLLFLIAFAAIFTTTEAQSFEWNKKSSPTTQAKSADLATYERAYNERQTGMAGVYSPGMEGSRTIYGETYASRELTASHAILPLGTLIRIVNLDNNRNIIVRVNDRGQECADCLLTLSQAAADQLGVSYRGRVSVERTGFSNWNPAPANPQPLTYNSTTTAGNTGVVRPVAVQGRTTGWQTKGNAAATQPATYNRRPAAYGSSSSTYSSDYVALGTPRTGSVMTREVDPSARASQPATYSRYPTTVRPQNINVAAPVYQPVSRPQAYGSTGQTAPAANVRPYQPAPRQAANQVAPPAPTVPLYQDRRTVAAPATYQSRIPAPVAYQQQTARSVQPYTPITAPAAAPKSGFAVQLGAYNNELYAKNRVNQLRAAGIANVFYLSANKSDGQVINRVYAGTFTNMAEAQMEANTIRKNHAIAGIVTSM